LSDSTGIHELNILQARLLDSKCDGGTMSAALNINTDSDALLYTGVTKEVFFTLVKCMSQFNTFKFQLEVTDQIMLVLLKSP
jgi:hypothetical protein